MKSSEISIWHIPKSNREILWAKTKRMHFFSGECPSVLYHSRPPRFNLFTHSSEKIWPNLGKLSNVPFWCPEDSEHKRRLDDQETGKIWIIEISWTAKKSKKSQKLLIIEQTKIFFIKLGIRLLRVFFNRFPSFRDLKSANWIVYESNLHLRWTRGLYRPHLFLYHHFDCSCCHVILENLYIYGLVGGIQNSTEIWLRQGFG